MRLQRFWHVTLPMLQAGAHRLDRHRHDHHRDDLRPGQDHDQWRADAFDPDAGLLHLASGFPRREFRLRRGDERRHAGDAGDRDAALSPRRARQSRGAPMLPRYNLRLHRRADRSTSSGCSSSSPSCSSRSLWMVLASLRPVVETLHDPPIWLPQGAHLRSLSEAPLRPDPARLFRQHLHHRDFGTAVLSIALARFAPTASPASASAVRA